MDKIGYSGKQVIRAGEALISDRIFDSDEEFNAAFDVLSYWRFSHEAPLVNAFNLLQEITLKKDKTAIFAKRLKRYVSIVLKLRRFREMKLKNMQDIGGCRAIIANEKKLMQVVRELRKRPEFKNSNGQIRAKDYIKKPKDDGYRGYHLIGKFPDNEGETRSIELQLRTCLQHDWATAVEIVDLFTGQALKSNQGDAEWRDFFSDVSAHFSVMESIHLFDSLDERKRVEVFNGKLHNSHELIESCSNIQVLAKRLKVVKLLEAYAHSLKVVDGQLEESSFDGYVLLEVNTLKKTVTSSLFSQEQNVDAEKRYGEAEKRAAEEADLVVALVSTTALGGIKEAYPNYFADSSEFLTHLQYILESPVTKQKSLFSRLFET